MSAKPSPKVDLDMTRDKLQRLGLTYVLTEHPKAARAERLKCGHPRRGGEYL
jgi:hypothetical protein